MGTNTMMIIKIRRGRLDPKLRERAFFAFKNP
jgi:hypothetical protein